MKRAFTDLAIQRLRPPSSGRVEIGDAITPGLVLRVSERNVKSWSVIYKQPGERGLSPSGRPLRGHQHRLTLGQYPAKGLDAARAEAREIMETVLRGEDPAAARREAVRARVANTVEAVAARMIEQDARRNVESWRNIERVLQLHILPRWGARPLADIAWADVRALLDELIADDRRGTAREVRKHLSRLFNFATDRGLLAVSPMAGKRVKDLAQTEAGRELTDAELRAVWHGAGEMGYPFGPLVRLLILTGARKSEWGEARRAELDEGQRCLLVPRDRFKSRRDHLVPLPDATWQIVADLPAWDGYLFSTTGGARPVSGWSRAKARLDRLAGDVAPYRLHDLRVTAASRLARLGIRHEVKEAVLGHAKEGLDSTYNKYDYMEEKRAALATLAEHIRGIVE